MLSNTFSFEPANITFYGGVLTTTENPFQWIPNDDDLKKAFKPKRIIQVESARMTIVIWNDDTKTIVRCSSDEEFAPEFGVAMATMKKLYGTRSQFKKYLDKHTFWQDDYSARV